MSVDGIRDAFKAMIAGKLNCSVECSPLLGPQLMKAVKDYMAGKDLPVRIVTSEVVFPAEVARSVLPPASTDGPSLPGRPAPPRQPKSAQNS